MPLRRPDYQNNPETGFLGQQLDSIMPGLTGLAGLLGIKPDRDIWNMAAGDPNAYQQSAMGGNNSMADIRMSTARATFKQTLASEAAEDFRQRSVEGLNRVMGFPQGTAAERASSVYSPTGLLSAFAMKSFEFDKGQENLTQGFLEMNLMPITPGIIDNATMGSEYVSKQKRMQKAAADFSKNLGEAYTSNPGQFGNMTFGETGEVFAQMASRDTISIRDMTDSSGGADESRIKQTTGRVQEMSRAVSAMQELFGGSIPEVFDKLDQVFGGSASAMGGQELEGRVRELKQLSSVSGQSLQATAQMIQVGQQYATNAGFDSGIGTSAAMVTTAELGVNVDSSGFNMRRVDMGKVRGLALRNNVAAATSPFAQYYAGARQLYMQNERMGREGVTDEELSKEFFDKTKNVRTLGGLSAVTGSSGRNIQLEAMSEAAQISLSDDPRVAQAASRGAAERETTTVGSGVLRTLRDAGVNVNAGDVFEEVDGVRVVRGSDAIIKDLLGRTGNEDKQSEIRGLTNQAIASYATLATGSRLNASEFNVRQRQQAGAPRQRALALAAAQFETEMAEFSGPGGFMGIMNFLADDSSGEDATDRKKTVGGFVSAFLGSMDPKDVNKATRKGDAEGYVAAAVSAFKDGKSDSATRERLGVIFSAIADPAQMSKIMKNRSKQELEAADQIIRNGSVTAEDVKTLSYTFGTDKLRSKEDLQARLEKAGTSLTDFDLETGEGKRDALVKGALYGKTGITSTKYKTAKELEAYLLKDDTSMGDIYGRLKTSGISEAAQEAITNDLKKFSTGIDASPAQASLPDVLERLILVLTQIEAKQD